MRHVRFAFVLIGAALVASPAYAYKIYKLQGSQWAIICDDGTGYSFSGSEQGANDVAGLLCPGGVTVGGTVLVTHDANRLVKQDRSGRYVLIKPVAVKEEGLER